MNERLIKFMNQIAFVWYKLTRALLNDFPSLMSLTAGGKEIK